MKDHIDIALIFPPQWSPFQPPLSLPSLYSWIIKKKFSAKCFDFNIEFYWWLLSDECASLLLETVALSGLPEKTKAVYRLIFSESKTIRNDVKSLLASHSRNDQDLLHNHFISSKALDLYLKAISDVQGSFDISAYEFTITNNCLNSTNIEKFIDNPPKVIRFFVESEVKKIMDDCNSLSFGISCIGQEQLVLSLLIGRRIKELSGLPVVVGGTILSRIFKRGTLPKSWFKKYFDIIVINEGEKPLEGLLNYFNNKQCELKEIDGVVFYDVTLDKIISTNPSKPLNPIDIPIPNFDGMPLSKYISSEITLPLLSSRGCYWGKCSFCHHGMVYGEKYSTYEVDIILETLNTYSERYGAKCFAFNDEAIPPKILRKMGLLFPNHFDSGWSFTGLIKFEKYFNKADFENANQVGFKSLYVGLESASEKVLKLMKKSNTKETMLKNLSDATTAGILIHCFVFFGFPGENEEDAEETYNFLLENKSIIGSVGCGTFSLEHDAPIFHDLASHGVSLLIEDNNSLNVYYKYKVEQGINQKRAQFWSKKLNDKIFNTPKYAATNWIPREHQLIILKHYSLAEIINWGENLIRWRNTPPSMAISDLILTNRENQIIIMVNRLNRKSLYITGYTAKALVLMIERNIKISELREFSENLL